MNLIKTILMYIISLLIILILDIITILWFARSSFLFITISCIINFIIIRFVEKIFKGKKMYFSLGLTVIIYVFLLLWYIFTYSCKDCYDLLLIKALLPIPIITYVLNLIYECVVKRIYASRDK